MSLELVVLGTGGMVPLPQRHLVSLLIRKGGRSFLFDCGEGTQVALKKAQMKWKNIEAIFLTHMHADHITGLPGMLMLSSQVDRIEPLRIFGPICIKSYIETSKKILEMYLNYPLLIREIEVMPEKQILLDDEEIQISCYGLVHSKPCMAYVFEEKERPGIFYPEKAMTLNIPKGRLWGKLQKGESIKVEGKIIHPSDVMGEKRKGLKVVYITDTMYFPGLIDIAKDADMLFIEGMFEKDLLDQAFLKKHMTVIQSANVGLKAHVQKMGLLHYSPRYQFTALKILLKQAKSVFPATFLTHDGQKIELTSP